MERGFYDSGQRRRPRPRLVAVGNAESATAIDVTHRVTEAP